MQPLPSQKKACLADERTLCDIIVRELSPVSEEARQDAVCWNHLNSLKTEISMTTERSDSPGH